MGFRAIVLGLQAVGFEKGLCLKFANMLTNYLGLKTRFGDLYTREHKPTNRKPKTSQRSWAVGAIPGGMVRFFVIFLESPTRG